MSASNQEALHPDAQTETPTVTPLADTAALHELLTTMNTNWATLGQTFQVLNEQSAKTSTVRPTMQDSIVEIQNLRRQLRAQDKKQSVRVTEVRSTIQNLLKDQVADEMRAHMQEQIKLEVALQVKEQMDAQMREHLPMPLKQLAEEGRQQVVDVRHALVNSGARRKNSVLDASYVDDPIAVVMKPDGTKSDLYPADLRSLFSYDEDMVKALLRDYRLPELPSRDENIERFMCHIGISPQMEPVPLLI